MNFKMLQEGDGIYTVSVDISQDMEMYMKIFEKIDLCEDCRFKLKLAFYKEHQEILKTLLQKVGASKERG